LELSLPPDSDQKNAWSPAELPTFPLGRLARIKTGAGASGADFCPGQQKGKRRASAQNPSRRIVTMVFTALSLLTIVISPLAAASDDILFSADLSADNQSAPIESPGTGHIDLWLERATLRIKWRVTFKDLASPIVEVGLYGPENPGANAGLLIDLGKSGSPIEGAANLSEGQFQYLITTRVYANILTRQFPDGELRGHLRRQLAGPSSL
jgi:CHRD domain